MSRPKTGMDVAVAWLTMQKERVHRMEEVITAFQTQLEKLVIDEKELNAKAGTYEYANNVTADIEELRWMAVCDMATGMAVKKEMEEG